MSEYRVYPLHKCPRCNQNMWVISTHECCPDSARCISCGITLNPDQIHKIPDQYVPELAGTYLFSKSDLWVQDIIPCGIWRRVLITGPTCYQVILVAEKHFALAPFEMTEYVSNMFTNWRRLWRPVIRFLYEITFGTGRILSIEGLDL